MNRWGIPAWLEEEVRERDNTCVYCGVQMTEKMPARGPRSTVATWEHIINNKTITTRDNIARCCAACNSSKGTKDLSDWIQSSYCKKHSIRKDTVAEVVRKALEADAYPEVQVMRRRLHQQPSSYSFLAETQRACGPPRSPTGQEKLLPLPAPNWMSSLCVRN